MVSIEDNFIIGYWAIGIVALYCAICFLIILVGACRHYKHRLRVWKAKKAYKQQRKYLQVNREVTRQARRIRMHTIRNGPLSLKNQEASESEESDDESESDSLDGSLESRDSSLASSSSSSGEEEKERLSEILAGSKVPSIKEVAPEDETDR